MQRPHRFLRLPATTIPSQKSYKSCMTTINNRMCLFSNLKILFCSVVFIHAHAHTMSVRKSIFTHSCRRVLKHVPQVQKHYQSKCWSLHKLYVGEFILLLFYLWMSYRVLHFGERPKSHIG